MDQQNKTNIDNQLTFIDLVRMFKGKLKYFICIALIAAIAGAALGIAIATFNVSYSGDVEFYLSPGDSGNLLLPTLQSDMFAEKLLLDEYGLPVDADKNSEDYVAAKKAAIAAEEARQLHKELNITYSDLGYELVPVKETYERLNKVYSETLSLLSIYKNSESGNNSDALDPGHKETVAELEKQLDAAKKARDEYAESTYYPLSDEREAVAKQIYEVNLDWKEARKDAEEKAEKLLSSWRKRPDIIAQVNKIQASVTYEYAKLVEKKNADATNDTKNQNYAFLIVKLNVERDEAFANELNDLVQSRLPDYVEKRMELLSGNDNASCRLVSTFVDIESSAQKDMINNAAIFAAVAAIAAIAIYTVKVIVGSRLPEDLKSGKKAKKEKRS